MLSSTLRPLRPLPPRSPVALAVANRPLARPAARPHAVPASAAPRTRAPARAPVRTAAAAAVAAPAVGMTATQLFATIIGYCVLLGSCIRSLPQIIKIVRAKSVAGLSLTANASELIAYSITFSYNYRLGYGFSTYGELVSCWIQDIVLVGLLLYYGRGVSKRTLAAALGYGALLYAFMSGAVPMPVLTWLQASTIAIVALGGRLPQILLNRKRGGSGQLSATTCGLNLAGNAARVFTTVVLTGDVLNLVGAVIQGGLNATLLAQCVSTRRAVSAAAAAAAEDAKKTDAVVADGGEGEGAAPAVVLGLAGA